MGNIISFFSYIVFYIIVVYLSVQSDFVNKTSDTEFSLGIVLFSLFIYYFIFLKKEYKKGLLHAILSLFIINAIFICLSFILDNPENLFSFEIENLFFVYFTFLFMYPITALAFNFIYKIKENSIELEKHKEDMVIHMRENGINQFECPIQIKGDEKLNEAPMKILGVIISIWTLLCIVLGIIAIVQGENIIEGFGYAALLWVFGGFILMITGKFVYLFVPSYHRKVDETKVIYEYFKKRFPILDSFNENKYIQLDIVEEKDKNRDNMLFNIFMQAYKLEADAIILNSSAVSTHISSNKHGVGSSNTHHMTATIVKYK